MCRLIRVGIGSTNAAKIAAVGLALEQIWPGVDLQLIEADVESGVSSQPMSMIESQLGSKNRAAAVLALLADQIDFAVGIEGGVETGADGETWYQCDWCTVMDRSGNIGLASTARSPVSRSGILSEFYDD
uniref:inosine/xanthosine triphosphatase n=1 Tax=Spongospora subterranea TaxID=70186 RepID=A0A0H5QNX1_9EUKA|eukprot:CRZ03090.1 hypothetical protein [Spongospora subterranea]